MTGAPVLMITDIAGSVYAVPCLLEIPAAGKLGATNASGIINRVRSVFPFFPAQHWLYSKVLLLFLP